MCSCSWRAPLTTGNSEIRVVVSQQLGEVGPNDSPPAIVPWRWHYHLPNVALWLAAIVALIASRAAAARRDWLIVVALVLSFILWQMEGFSILIAVLAVVWMTGARQNPSSVG